MDTAPSARFLVLVTRLVRVQDKHSNAEWLLTDEWHNGCVQFLCCVSQLSLIDLRHFALQSLTDPTLTKRTQGGYYRIGQKLPGTPTVH